MWNVVGVLTNSISPYPLVTRGMPGEKQRYVMLAVPCPPYALVASKIAWYSGVSGALWSRAKRPGPPIGRHCPLKSGYFESSQAEAPAVVKQSAPASARALIKLRYNILVSLRLIAAYCAAGFLFMSVGRAARPVQGRAYCLALASTATARLRSLNRSRVSDNEELAGTRPIAGLAVATTGPWVGRGI